VSTLLITHDQEEALFGRYHPEQLALKPTDRMTAMPDRTPVGTIERISRFGSYAMIAVRLDRDGNRVTVRRTGLHDLGVGDRVVVWAPRLPGSWCAPDPAGESAACAPYAPICSPRGSIVESAGRVRYWMPRGESTCSMPETIPPIRPASFPSELCVTERLRVASGCACW